MTTLYQQMQEAGAQLIVKRAYILGRSAPMDSMPVSHAHDSFEIIYVNCDQCRFVLGDSAYQLSRQDVVLYHSAVPHRIEWTAQALRPLYGITVECARFDAPSLSCAQMLRASPLLREFFASFDAMALLRGAGSVFATLHQLTLELLSGNDPGYETLLLNKLLIDIARMHSAEQSPASRYAHQVRRYIDAHYAVIADVEEIAGMLSLTKNHVQRLFKAQTGQSLWQYLTGVRIQNAQRLLTESAAPIGEIGSMVGIHSRQNFNLCFRRICGMTPQAYRQRAHAPRSGEVSV